MSEARPLIHSLLIACPRCKRAMNAISDTEVQCDNPECDGFAKPMRATMPMLSVELAEENALATSGRERKDPQG